MVTIFLFSGDSLGLSTGAGAVHNNIRLTLGMFTIFPANGVVLPGSSTTITVDMLSEISMVGEEVRCVTEQNLNLVKFIKGNTKD